MISTDSTRGRITLGIAHCAGLVDMVALPLWVGALVQYFGFDSQQAGLLVTMFLVGGVVASMAISPVFHRMRSGRVVAVGGYACTALAFGAAACASSFESMALLHIVGGAGVGAALSVTHGTVARSANPHRLFALCGTALGLFALGFLGVMPPLIAQSGGAALFLVFALMMAAGAVASALGFPGVESAPSERPAAQGAASSLPQGVWGGILGMCCMSLIQAMAFGFVERVGVSRGFDVMQITSVLVILGVVNLFPTGMAALLQRRWPARRVLMTGPVMQAMLVFSIFTMPSFAAFAMAGSLFVAVLQFTHVFAFGLLAHLDRSGRTLAATPAMMMTGAAIGPVLGGTLVKFSGYPAIGVVALGVGSLAVLFFSRLPQPALTSSTAQVVA